MRRVWWQIPALPARISASGGHYRGGVRFKSSVHVGCRWRHIPGPMRHKWLKALAICLEQLVRDGAVADYAELARLGHVSRARIIHIMNLLNLAPEIQQQVLFPSAIECWKDAITERDLRAIVAAVDWRKQGRMWFSILAPEIGPDCAQD